ncbi:MAG: hypothetical protein ACR2OJ_08865 [Hyphomicrobiales bacterium]
MMNFKLTRRTVVSALASAAIVAGAALPSLAQDKTTRCQQWWMPNFTK